MARSSTPFKRGKPVYTLLAVTCGRKVESNDGGAVVAAAAAAAAAPGAGTATAVGSTKGEVLLPNAKSGGENDAFLLPDKEELLPRKAKPCLPGYPDLVSKGQLEIHLLDCPSKEEVKAKMDSLHPDYLSLHGEQVSDRDDIGGLVLGDEKACTPDELASLFGTKLPDLVYLEIASGDKSGQALRALGIKHVIYWKISSCTHSVAFHFRQGLIAALQSSAAGGWDAYRLAKACSQVYFCRSKLEGQPVAKNCSPNLLGDAPSKIEVTPPDDGETSKASDAALSAVQIFDDDIEIRLLVCTEISKIDVAWLDAMEAGLTAMLTIEARSLRMLNKMSAPPPPMAAAVFARGVVTMRCDICTTSLARVAILVSGSAQLCFDDQQLENSIKKELLEKARLVRIVKPVGDRKTAFQVSEMRRSICMASGARVVEIRFTTPAWAGQVLRQLGTDPTYRSLAALGIAGLQGGIVAAFTKEDAVQLASSKFEPRKMYRGSFPAWLISPPAIRDRANLFNLYNSSDESMDREVKPLKANKGKDSNNFVQNQPTVGVNSGTGHGKRLELTSKQRAVLEAMKPFPSRVGPIPSRYAALIAAARASGQIKVNLPNGTSKGGRPHLSSLSGPAPSHTPSALSNYSQSIAPGSLLLAGNANLVKPHGCSRRPIDDCAEEDFVADLIKFLVSRGHGRLIPPVGAEGFPEVVLNGKRLDLYNLYREVVSRGGFHVGNGINWKGQVFSKMRNHTLTNKMTGVGNTLKKHYETYLLEYELAHNDVDGECCILCHSGAAGDWVNCGSCGEWAHFGCDKRTGLGTFKDYSKTDGLEYICPNCNAANGRSGKRQKVRRASGVAHAEVVVTKGVPRKTR